MRKMIAIFTVATILIFQAPFFAQAASPDAADKPAKRDTIFNRCSDFFDTFNRPFKRQGNKQKFFTATAEWIKTINKY